MADTVLDDALADFDIPADRLQSAALKADATIDAAPAQQDIAASSSSAAVPGGSSAPDDGGPSSKPFNALPERKKKSTAAGKAGSFDPLGKGNLRKKPTVRSSPKPEPGSGAASSSSKPKPPDKQPGAAAPASGAARDTAMDKELAHGMAELMAELAKADGRSSTEQGPQASKGGPHEREMASTLAALAAAAPSSGDHPGLEHMGGGEGDSEGSFASLADTIMQQLLSKDVLYQPMKDIGAKYPGWLAAHRESLPAGEVQRYEAQYRFIQQICALYEEEPNDFGKLFTLIQEMQACGQPPDEIVQDLAPGLAFGEDGLPQLPTSATDKCTIC